MVIYQEKSNVDYGEEDFGPKIVAVNYYAGMSVDSSQASSVSKTKQLALGQMYGTDDGDGEKNREKFGERRVRFKKDPEIFLIKSYKKYNKKTYKSGGCRCVVF